MFALHDYFLFVLIAIAFYTDVRYKKLPNWLTASGMLVGVVYHFIVGGVDGLVFAFFGLLVGGGIFLVLYIFKVIGAGDVKLFAAIGAIIGVNVVLYIMMYSVVFAGVLAIIILLSTRTFLARILTGITEFMGSMLSRDFNRMESYKTTKATRFPFMYAVLPAVVVAYYYVYFV